MNSTKTARTKHMCLLCGEFSENGPGFCAVNLHQFDELQLNEKKNGYNGFFQKGAAHLRCLEQYFDLDHLDESTCAVCHSGVSSRRSGLKLAVYVYRKRGCYCVASLHEKCFRNIKHTDFPLIR